MQIEHHVTFDRYRFDLAREQLWCGSEEIPLPGKAFAMLRYLVEHAGQLVSKEEVFAALWPGTAVTDGALTFCIVELRKALGDNAKAPRFIETVHRRGYRFLPTVTTTSLQGSGVGDQGSVRESRTEVARRPEHAVSAPNPDPRTPVPALVGREADLTQLHNWLAKALNGERQIVFVTGEAGIGKTTLLEAFLFGVRSREEFGVPKSPKSKVQGPKSPNTDPRTPSPEPWFARGQCIDHYGPGEPYMPILEAFGRLCGTPEGKQVVTLLQQHAPTWLAQMPSLLTAAEREALQRTTQGATRERMLREMGEAIDVMTAERPLVLVLEDLHWSDVSTLELLALLARRREPARLLVIGTYRSSDLLSPDHPLKSGIQELRIHDLCTELALPPLSQDDIETYLRSRFSGHALPPTLPQALYRRTEGHPFFLVTVVDDLVTQGLLGQTEHQVLVQGDNDAIVRQIPDSIRLLLTHQADRLLPLECRVLEAASVIGAEFATASLAAALAMDSEDVEEWCAGLAARQLFLRPAGLSEWPDGTASERYRFVHALSQQLWHERTGMIRRQRLHYRIAERHEVAYRNRTEEIAAELAVHFEQARDYARATRYLAQAAEGAIRRCAHEEAVTHLTKSLALLRTLPDTPERTQLELALHTTLGISLQAVRGYGNPLVEQAYARARALSARVHDPEQLFPVLFGLWQLHLTRAEYSVARTQGDQLLSLAQRSHNPALLTEAHGLVGVTLFHLGEIGAARSHFEAGMTVYDPAHHRSLAKTYSQDPWVACRSYSAHVLWLLGYRDQAFTRVREALCRARELGHPFSEAFALHDEVFIHQLSDNASAVRVEVEVLLALARAHGFQHWELAAHGLRGWALAREGDSVVGLGLMREGSGVRQNLGSNLRMPYHHARMAELYGQAERPDEGLNQLEKALSIMTTTGERWWEAELYRLYGDLLLQQESQKSKVKGQKGFVA